MSAAAAPHRAPGAPDHMPTVRGRARQGWWQRQRALRVARRRRLPRPQRGAAPLRAAAAQTTPRVPTPRVRRRYRRATPFALRARARAREPHRCLRRTAPPTAARARALRQTRGRRWRWHARLPGARGAPGEEAAQVCAHAHPTRHLHSMRRLWAQVCVCVWHDATRENAPLHPSLLCAPSNANAPQTAQSPDTRIYSQGIWPFGFTQLDRKVKWPTYKKGTLMQAS